MAGRTVTLLFTDIEGSTRLWEEAPKAMALALARHDAILRGAIESAGGEVFKTVGDAFCAAFEDAPAAAAASLDAQRALVEERWATPRPIRVRMALHTGTCEARDGDFFGPPLNRVARLLATAHGGQTVASDAAYEIVRDSLPKGAFFAPLGEHRLKDLARPETVHGLLHPALPSEFPPLRSLGSATLPTNLPAQTTSFVGRERELREVAEALRRTPLITLAGPGGTGKTRLALQVAAEAIEAYPGGAWIVELASLTDPALVAATLAGVLGVSEETGRPLLSTLADRLRKAPTLLILDNCEHLLDAAARLAEGLLRAVPSLRVLATSREPLGVPGETLVRVPSLSLPKREERPTAESLSHYEAVRLFVERAVAQRFDFAVTNANAPAVASLVLRLDGIPLAIELAAARVRGMSVEAIEARLDDRFRLLTGGARTALPRQQTLRALVEWSHDLLNDAERAALRRLAVFAGGWTLEAAEAVAVGEGVEDWEVLDLVASLVDKSLVTVDESEGDVRYGMLETIRHYAGERLREAGEEGDVSARHAAFFAARAKEATQRPEGFPGPADLRRLTAEWDNLRAAFDRGTPRQRLEMAGTLNHFWGVKGAFREGLARAAAALRDDAPPSQDLLRFAALKCAGSMATTAGDADVALAYMAEAAALARALGATDRLVHLLSNLGYALAQAGDRAGGRAAFEEAMAIHPTFGALANLVPLLTDSGDYAEAERTLERIDALFRDDPTQDVPYSRLFAHQRRATVYLGQGRAAEAERAAEAALSIAREIEYASIEGHLRGLVGRCARAQGRFAEAAALARAALDGADLTDERVDALTLLAGASLGLGDLDGARAALGDALALGHLPLLAPLLEAAAATLAALGGAREAAVVLGAADVERRRLPTPLPPGDAPEHEALWVRVRETLGEAAFRVAFAEGATMDGEAARAYARQMLTMANDGSR